MYNPCRGGVRGGADQFTWESVKSDKHRENYLGHSLMAPVGRWQKGKDLSWYAKERKNPDGSIQDEKSELLKIKKAEEEAMLMALGHQIVKQETQTLTKEEMREALKRNIGNRDEYNVERVDGVGASRRAALLSGVGKNTSLKTEGVIFENRRDPVNTSKKEQIVHPIKEKKSKKSKKHKKEKKHKKHRESPESDSDSNHHIKEKKYKKHHKDSQESDSDDYRLKQRKKHGRQDEKSSDYDSGDNHKKEKKYQKNHKDSLESDLEDNYLNNNAMYRKENSSSDTKSSNKHKKCKHRHQESSDDSGTGAKYFNRHKRTKQEDFSADSANERHLKHKSHKKHKTQDVTKQRHDTSESE